jgi:hypothetical protein
MKAYLVPLGFFLLAGLLGLPLGFELLTELGEFGLLLLLSKRSDRFGGLAEVGVVSAGMEVSTRGKSL